MISIRATAFVMMIFGAMSASISLVKAEDPDNYVHTFTGFTFPPKVADFTRVKIMPFNEDKSDIGVDYDNSPFTTHISVYVYPANEPLKQHYEECRQAVTKPHPEAKLLEEKPATLTKNGKTYEGYSALLTFKDTFVGHADQELLSRVILFQTGHYYVLFRISYAASDKVNAEKQIHEFLEKLTWPPEPKKSPDRMSD